MTYENLPREAHIKMAELVSTPNKRGLTPFSESTIRRLIDKGEFPAPKRYPAMPCSTFFVYGDIQDWLNAHNTLLDKGVDHE